jgi:hypothetical protein
MPKLDHGVEDNEHAHWFSLLEFKKAVKSGVHDGEENNEQHGLW